MSAAVARTTRPAARQGSPTARTGGWGPRHRWWQVVVRAAALAGVALVLLYVSLPWWAPREFLARQLAEYLSAHLRTGVAVPELELSWSRGIVLRNLVIDCPADAYAAPTPASAPAPLPGKARPMIRIGRLQTELSPLRMLAGEPLDRVELSDVQVALEVDGLGRVNLAMLGRLPPGGAPKRDESRLGTPPPPRRLDVRDVRLDVYLPDSPVLRVDVGELHYLGGRLDSLGRVTLSAQLQQQPEPAPVSLVASAVEGGPVAARCSFRVAALDLGQLALPRVLGLPLERLGGIGSGQLDCQISRGGVIEQFSLSLKVRDLDAQPAGGPPLPVIQEAQLQLQARYDYFTHALDLHQFRLLLPGVDLGGQGHVLIGDVPGALEGLRSLDLSGRVNPAMLTALLSGRAQPLPGGLEIDGDVAVQLALRGSATHLASDIVLDAGGASLRLGSRVIKPARRPLAVSLQGSVEMRSWQFTVDQTELTLGANRFQGRGAMQNIRRVIERWRSAGPELTLATVQQELASLDWRGSCRIVEAQSLGQLLGLPALERVRLDGAVTAQWSAEHADRVLLRADVQVPGDTELAVDGIFRKPRGPTGTLELSGDVHVDQPRLSRCRVWAAVGEAGLSIEDAQVSFGEVALPGGRRGLSVRGEGRWGLRDVGSLLANAPAVPAWARSAQGHLTGRFDCVLAPGLQRGQLELNATQLGLELEGELSKASGQPAELSLDWRSDATLGDAQRNRLGVRALLGSTRLAGELTFPPAGSDQPLRGSVRAAVGDAAWLLARTPRLAERLGPLDVQGSLDAEAEGVLSDAGGSLDVRLDAGDLQFRLPATGGRKERGVPLRLRLSGRRQGAQVHVESLSVDLGRSSFQASGRGGPATQPVQAVVAQPFQAVQPQAQVGKPVPPEAQGGKPAPPEAQVGKSVPPCWPPPGLEELEASFRGRFVIDGAARSLIPQLAAQMAGVRIDGAWRCQGRLTGSPKGLALAASADAAGLAVELPDRFRKPAAAPARLEVELFLPGDGSKLDVRNLFLDGGDYQVRAGLTVPLRAGESAVGQAALNVPELSRVAALVPALAPYAPSGSLLVDVGGSWGRETIVKFASIHVDRLALNFRGKSCRASGTVLLEDLVPARAWSIGRASTPQLELSAGESHGFVVAELTGLPDSPTGQVELLCDMLDDQELASLGGPTTAPARRKLSAEEGQALQRRAEQVIAELAQALARAKLQVRVESQRLRHYDPVVHAFFDATELLADVDIQGRSVRANYRCGLSGGQLENRYVLDLSQPNCRLGVQGQMRNLMINEGIQAQLAREFPGNTVYGTFSRTEEVSYLLRDVVANSLDSRYEAIRVGKAVTVTENGSVRGRAAPKFITNIFPGLNLATYSYRRMTGFADLHQDGGGVNDMIFEGANYDIYTSGTTDANRIADYEIGVLLLASPQSPQLLHEHRLGRMPILNFRARIENSRFVDEQVRYPYPTETAYALFFKNTPLYTLWQQARARQGAASVGAAPVILPSKE